MPRKKYAALKFSFLRSPLRVFGENLFLARQLPLKRMDDKKYFFYLGDFFNIKIFCTNCRLGVKIYTRFTPLLSEFFAAVH